MKTSHSTCIVAVKLSCRDWKPIWVYERGALYGMIFISYFYFVYSNEQNV